MNTCQEKTVNARNSPLHNTPTIAELRMSRLRYPRGTLMAMILLAVVFLLFGLFASAIQPEYAAPPETITGLLSSLSEWATGATGSPGQAC